MVSWASPSVREVRTRTNDTVNDLRKPPGDRESAVHPTIWQVNFADDQILELTQAEIEQDLAAGNLTRENWVWRDGMASWLPITDVPEFASALNTAAPPSGFRPRPDDEVESIPLEPDEDEQTVALKNPAFLSAYERPAPQLEFSVEAEPDAEPPTSRAPSVVPSRIESVGPDKTPAYGSTAPGPSSGSAAAGASRSAAPAAILLRGSAPPSAAPSAESPPPLPPRKPVIPISVASSPNASPRPLPTPSPEQPVRAAGSVFPPPSPGAELVAPRPMPQAELAAPKPVPAEPLVATPAPPPVFEDLGLLIPEEMKSDAVWPAPDPSLARQAAQAAETPLPLRSRPAAAPAARARPIANEPLVIVAGPSETLPAASEVSEKAAPARDVVMPKLPVKAAPPIVMRELPAAKAQLVDIKASELMNESTLITGRRRTKHWVSMTNAVIGAICAASIAAALTALVMQATEQSRLRAAAQLVPASATLAAVPTEKAVPVTEPAAAAPKAEQGAATAAESAAAAQPAVAGGNPVVAPEPKPEVTPEQPVAVKAPNAAAAKRRPAQKASTNPYDDYPPSSESPKRSPAKSADDARNIPSHPGF
jgi:hypothetical protein